MDATAEFGEQQEVTERFAGRWEPRVGPAGAEQSLAVEQQFDLRPPVRESAEEFLDGSTGAVLVAEAEFLVDEVGGRFGVLPQVRVAVEEFFRQRPFAGLPATGHLPGEFGRHASAASRDSGGRSVSVAVIGGISVDTVGDGFSRGAAEDSSPRREPWETAPPLICSPGGAEASFAPPGLQQ